MTQRELGIRLGYKENGADVRIAQYEADHRRPKEETLYQIAEILEVSPFHFIRLEEGSPEEVIRSLLWLEEEKPDLIQHLKIGIAVWEWLSKKEAVRMGIMTEEEYQEWKWKQIGKDIFPEANSMVRCVGM